MLLANSVGHQTPMFTIANIVVDEKISYFINILDGALKALPLSFIYYVALYQLCFNNYHFFAKIGLF